MKDFTIVRRRVVTQISTDQVRAKNENHALKIINDLQREEDAGGEMEDYNEWHTSEDAEYPELTSDDILESVEIE